jgi:hypothetical protein
MCIKFGTADARNTVVGDYDFRENQRIESHTSLKGRKQITHLLCHVSEFRIRDWNIILLGF